MAGATQKVCVTGATGYVARQLVRYLLNSKQNNYIVNATVRSLDPKNSKTRMLTNLQKFDQFVLSKENRNIDSSRLNLYSSDLLEDGSFEDAIKGCDVVYHTASPFFNMKIPEDWRNNDDAIEEMNEKLLKPAVEGTRNVIETCLRNNVKRIVLTSSVAAMARTNHPSRIITESNWNSIHDIDYAGGPYRLSKTRAEKLAWDLISEHHQNMKDSSREPTQLTSINPSLVIGQIAPFDVPPTHEYYTAEKKNESLLGTSASLMRDFLNGKIKYIPNGNISYCDVKDVALAHIIASRAEQAKGQRYIVSSESLPFYQFINTLKQMYPEYPIASEWENPYQEEKKDMTFVSTKVQEELGFTLNTREGSIKEMVEDLKRLEFINPKK